MSAIRLKTQHLYIDADIAQRALGDTVQVYTVYYPQKQSLLLAPMNDEFFPKLHKAHLQMMKTRNLKGDKTISIQEILIDNDIDDTDRDLEYELTDGIHLLNIKI